MTLRQLILTLIPYTTLFRSLWTWSKPLLKKKGATAGGALPGLICLKGGDLAAEIAESECRPRVEEIYNIFPEEYFKEKYLLFVPARLQRTTYKSATKR